MQLHAMQDVVVDGDKTSMHAVAAALLQLQAMYGAPSLIRGKGPGAAVVKDMLLRMQQELGSQAPVPGQPMHRMLSLRALSVLFSFHVP